MHKAILAEHIFSSKFVVIWAVSNN